MLNLDVLFILFVECLDYGFDDLADFFFVFCCRVVMCDVSAFVG